MKADYPSVLLIYTGGTIGMIENPETGALENFNFDHLLKHVPELKRFNYRISSYQFDPPIDSSDMEPAFWAKLVEIINYNYDSFDGFVILHGTDTMAYTASALSFMLENLSKPVILTGFEQAPETTLSIRYQCSNTHAFPRNTRGHCFGTASCTGTQSSGTQNFRIGECSPKGVVYQRTERCHRPGNHHRQHHPMRFRRRRNGTLRNRNPITAGRGDQRL